MKKKELQDKGPMETIVTRQKTYGNKTKGQKN